MTGRRSVGVSLAALSGLALAAQARVNGELAVRLGDGIAAAVVSFGVGMVVLVVAVPLTRPGRRSLRALRDAADSGVLRWWHFLGGLCGGFVVAVQGLTVADLGVAVFTVAIVAGQTGSGLVVDRTGLAPGGAEPVSRLRVAGAALTVVAVVVAVGNRIGTPEALGLAVLPLVAGVGVAFQAAVNGQVRAVAGSALTATFVNFSVGGAGLLVGFATAVAVRGWPDGGPPTEPWLYSGGVLGVLVIVTAAAVVEGTGVLLLGLATIFGQLTGALVLDLVVPTAGPPRATTYLGTALALVAVALTLSGGRWRPAGQRA